MMSFQTIYSQVQSLCNDSNSTTLTLLKNFINQTQNYLLALRKDITETSITDTTVASQANYDLPYNYGKMFMVTVTVSSVAYPLYSIEDDSLIRDLVARASSCTSDIPEFYYIFNDSLYIYPTPASSSNTITMYYHKIVKPMTVADYTTGTITTLTNGASAVTGDSTLWTAAMVGRFLNITSDGYWYEIESRTSNTIITIKKNFQGTSIAAGTEAYTIGEMPIIPEAYHEMLVWRPIALYYQEKGEFDKANYYWGLFREMKKDFIRDRSAKTESAIITGRLGDLKQNLGIRNPQNYPTGLTT